MRIPSFILALMVMLCAAPTSSAQTPATTPASGTLMEVTFETPAPDLVVATGIVRTIYPAGASLRLDIGSGPSLHFVESGTLTLAIGDGASALVIRAGAAGSVATPETVASGSEVVVATGDGFLLTPGATADIRNDGPNPATVLDLLAAPDATADAGDGIAQEILVRQEVTLPAAAVTVTLSRATVEKGGRVPIAEAPALTFYTAVERSDAFNLTGQGYSRLGNPIDAYVLVIAPAT